MRIVDKQIHTLIWSMILYPLLKFYHCYYIFFFFFTAIGRTLIPRYFRTMFEGGVTDLYYLLKHPKESFHNTTITLDCDQTTMVTHHGKPMFTKVNWSTDEYGNNKHSSICRFVVCQGLIGDLKVKGGRFKSNAKIVFRIGW